MIKSVSIENFQSHKSSLLEFDPGVNIIIGQSDCGKTAIIRALNWLVSNRPQGDAFRSWTGGDVCVTATFTDGTVITRSKTKQDEYKVNDTVFKAFKTEVPEEVQNALNINEINLQKQLDAPFLLSESPGAVAQHFNRVAKLDKIDSGLQNVSRDLRQITNDLSYKEQQQTKQVEDLEAFDYLEKFEIEVEALELLDDKYNNSIKSKAKLQTLIKNIQQLNCDLQEACVIIELEPQILRILDKYKQIQTSVKEKGVLQKHITKIETTTTNINQYRSLIDIEEPVLSLLETYKRLTALIEKENKLTRLTNRIYNIQKEIEDESETLKDNQDCFTTNFPDVCPLCNTIIKK